MLPVMHRVVDAMNVVGSRPDGWWRDRAGAVERLLARLEEWAERSGERVTVVLEKEPARPLAPARVTVEWASEPGRDAADREILRRLPGWLVEGEEVILVTSDRALAAQARAAGATVEPAAGFRRTLDH